MRITLFYGKWDANINCLNKIMRILVILTNIRLTELESMSQIYNVES